MVLGGGLPGRVGGCRFFNGRLAQLGERLPYKQDVIGSSPIVSRKCRGDAAFFDGVG